jgi:tetratricopeptide (TPR) repeat protein
LGAEVGGGNGRTWGKQGKGVQLLRECARGKGETGADAKILLVLFLRREGRFQEAHPINQELIAAYPRNILIAIEEGNLLRAEGNTEQAVATYRKVWQTGKSGRFGEGHYELAAISLGDLLRAKSDYAGEVTAYEQAASVANPEVDISQRANLSAGEVYDLLKKRDLALKNYHAVIAAGSSGPAAETANKYLKQPYAGP